MLKKESTLVPHLPACVHLDRFVVWLCLVVVYIHRSHTKMHTTVVAIDDSTGDC